MGALPTGSQLVPGTITLRGSGDGQIGYCFEGSTASIPNFAAGQTCRSNPPMSNLPGSLHGTSIADAKRRVRITVSPVPMSRVKVEVDFTGTGMQFETLFDVIAPPNAPSTYKFGWAGSTGANIDVHLIQNVTVETVNPLDVLTLVKQVDRSVPLPDPIVVGTVIPYEFVVTNGDSRC